MSVEILTVCSANICRSPFAEYVLQAKLAGIDAPVVVHSAGIYAMGGSAMEHYAQDLATKWGAKDVDKHVSARVTREAVATSSLVLTATHSQSMALTDAVPEASTRVFTTREFGYLAARIDDTQFRAATADFGTNFADLIAQIDQLRQQRESPDGSALDVDVPDPFGGDQAYYERAQELMIPGIDQVVRLVGLAAG